MVVVIDKGFNHFFRRIKLSVPSFSVYFCFYPTIDRFDHAIIRRSSNARHRANYVIIFKQAYRAKDTSARNRTKTTTRNDRRNANQTALAQKQLDEHKKIKDKTKIYQTDKDGKIKTDKNGNPVLTEYGKGQKEYAKPFKKASKKLAKEQDKTLEHGAKALGLSDEKKFSIPDIPVVNKFLPSTEEQQKQTRKTQLKAAGLDKQSIKDSLTEIDNYAKEQGFTDDTLLDNGKTYGQYRKELEAGMYADRDSAIKAINENMDKEGVGKFSATDIYKGGNKALDELADYLIPYGGSAKASLKAAEGILKAGKGAKAGKALTTLGDDVVKGLSKGGKKYVREAVENGLKKGDNLGDILKDISKTVSKSNLKQNIKKELIANAIQDATLGTTIDALKGKQQGLKGDEFKKYMAENAVMNAAFGMPISMIAGRTGKAGKLAIAEDIATEANKATDLAKAGGNIADISNGKVVAQNAETAVDSMSREEAKAYYNLKEKANNGTIKPEEQTQFNQLQDKVKEIFRQTETVSNKVINLKTLKSTDLHDAETAVKFFERTGDTNKLKVAQKALESAKVATRNLNESLDNAMKTMTEKTGIDYKWVTGDEMRALGADEDSVVKGFTHFDENGKATVLINRESPQAWQTVVGHETMHLIKKSDEKAFNDLGDALEKYAKELDEYDELEAVMRRNYPEFDAKSEDFREEMVSEMLGRYVFGEDDKFIKRLAGENPTALEKIVDYIKNLIKRSKNPELAEQFNKFVDSADEAIRAINKDEVAKNAKGAEGKKSMGGERAQGADLAKKREAERLYAEGKSLEEIHKKTGWIVDTDGKAKFEFSDSGMVVNGSNKTIRKWEENNTNLTVGDIITHRRLFGYYPDADKIPVTFKDAKLFPDNTNGQIVFHEDGSCTIEIAKGASKEQLGSTMLHELQHYIQYKEGFSRGASPDEWGEIYNYVSDHISAIKEYYNIPETTPNEFVPEMIHHVENDTDFAKEMIDHFREYDSAREKMVSGLKKMGLGQSSYAHKRILEGKEQYRNTKGEIEARETSNRMSATQEQLDANPRIPQKGELKIEDFEQYKYPKLDGESTTVYNIRGGGYNGNKGLLATRDLEGTDVPVQGKSRNADVDRPRNRSEQSETLEVEAAAEPRRKGDIGTTENGVNERPANAGSFNEEIKSLDPDYVKNIGTGAKFSKVAKPETLKFLDDQEKAGKTVEVYRAMVEIDGKLYPPMATKIKTGSGKAELQDANKLGEWVQADEHPELLDKDGKFVLQVQVHV